jgi:hypothetical protein
MRDQHNGAALGHKPPQPRKQLLGLWRREDRRGLVEDQEAGVAVECLEDFHALLRAHAKGGNACRRIHAKPGALNERLHARGHSAQIEATPPTERDVLGGGHGGHEREMLMYHAQAATNGVGAGGERHGGAVDVHATRVGRHQAEGNAHQGRLAGAVLSQHCVQRPSTNVQRSAAKRLHLAEPLVDRFEGKGAVAHSPVGASTKFHGTPACAAIHAASACTPSVSVA